MQNLDFRAEATDYSTYLAGYEAGVGLPMELFTNPDYVAIKTADAKQFNSLIKRWNDRFREAYFMEEDDRFLVAARIAGKMTVGVIGAVEWLTIKEPRPDKVGNDYVGLEYTEFYFPDFNRAVHEVTKRHVECEPEIEEKYRRLSVVFGEQGQEFKLSNTPLSTVITEKVQNGEASILKAA